MGFRFLKGTWTNISDDGRSHQFGKGYSVSFQQGWAHPKSQPPEMEAAFFFVAPSTDAFNFAITAVNSLVYPLTGQAHVCVRDLNLRGSVAHLTDGKNSDVPCIASGSVD